MPLYEYQCDSCGHRFETIQKFSDAPLDTCPKCGAAVRKLQSAPAFQFKGAGWYITDYAKKDSVSPGKSGDGATGADGGSSSTPSGGDQGSSTSKDSAAGSAAAPATSTSGDKSST